jgi:hypothetical protein
VGLLGACHAQVVDLGGPGSVACNDSGAGGRSSDASDEGRCPPAPCDIVGAWQFGGGEIMCTAGGMCAPVVRPCTQGAIRFDPSGTLFRFTDVGWETACGFATCGDRVTSAQLPNILTDNYAAMGACGPHWDVVVVASLEGDASTGGLATCTLNAYAPCEGGATASNGPPGIAPWTVELAYSRCSP